MLPFVRFLFNVGAGFETDWTASAITCSIWRVIAVNTALIVIIVSAIVIRRCRRGGRAGISGHLSRSDALARGGSVIQFQGLDHADEELLATVCGE